MDTTIEREDAGPSQPALVVAPAALRPRPVRVVVADSRHLIAEALASAVVGEEPFEIVATLWGAITPEAIAEADPDIVLVGIGADVAGALGLIDSLASRIGDAVIVLVADAPTRELLSLVLTRSLGGLLLTDHTAADLAASLRQIAHGSAVLPSGWQSVLAPARPGPLDALSGRQLEVLELLADGCSYEEIGRRLFISVNTVKFHTRSIFERLGVRNRMAAARVLADHRST